MNNTLAAFLLAVALVATPAARAEGNAADFTDMPALLKAVKADKKALVESTLQLTPAEAKKFWPVYTAYQRSVDMANRRRTLAMEDLIARDRPLSDLFAKNLANELIGADEMELKARRTMHNRVMKALPPKKAARYLQLESKIRDAQAYDVAAMFPLVK
jgi:Spy/CpxP family protein refolding chaperone